MKFTPSLNRSIASIVGLSLLALGWTPVAHAALFTTAPSYNSSTSPTLSTIIPTSNPLYAYYNQGGDGGMYMLNVSYTAATSTLSVAAQAKTITLAPRPTGSFDTAQAWGVLDNTAYSRRFGWNPGTGLSGIPSGDSIWIQVTSQTAGLETFYAQNASPGSSANTITQSYTYYGGIFGTGGSSTAWQWDQLMDHNAYAIPLANIQYGVGQTFTATYDLYIGDASGNRLPGFTDATETWTWTSPALSPSDVPEPASLSVMSAGAILLLRRRRHAH